VSTATSQIALEKKPAKPCRGQREFLVDNGREEASNGTS
jgi:hypothetical protein